MKIFSNDLSSTSGKKFYTNVLLLLVYMYRNCDKNVRKSNKKYVKILRYNRDRFRETVCMNDLQSLNTIGNLSECAKLFEDKLKNSVSKFVFKKQVTVRDNEWFNDEIRMLRRRKIVMYNRAVWLNNDNQWSEYRRLRNIYKHKISVASNQKSMWKTLKSYVLKESKENINEIVIDNERIRDDQKKANKLNTYFIENISEIRDPIPFVNYDEDIMEEVECRFRFRPVSVEDISGICKSMKQKNDFNNMNPKMIDDAITDIGPILVKIINTSMECGEFPDTWKEASVVPIQKVKNTSKCEEFRRINMMPLYEKIIEIAIHQQLKDYIERNGLIIEEQSGFREGHSCESALNWAIMEWKELMDKGKKIFGVFLNLKRAFETVDRDILIHKLGKYGIRGRELNWFVSYLSGRKQQTRVKTINTVFLKDQY